MTRVFPFLILTLTLTLSIGCTPTPSKTPAILFDDPATRGPTILKIFAAASLTEAFTDMGERFDDSHPGVRTVFNFAGSQQLAQQLALGAPADIIASADKEQMEVAIQTGRVSQESPLSFASNQLVVIFPIDNPANVRSLQDLANSNLDLVLAADAVPLGQYTLMFLDNANQNTAFSPDFKDSVLKNVVSYEENVKAVLTKVILGEAQAGIVYTSDVNSANISVIGTLDVPDSLNILATYYIAPTEDETQRELTGEFVGFVLSPEGQNILARYGFIPVR